MTYESLMNSNIYINTRASSQNAYNEWTYTYTASSTPTKCRIMPVTVAERIDAPGLYDNVSYICFALSSASITRDMQVTYRGNQYRVKEMEMDSSYHHKRALLEEVA